MYVLVLEHEEVSTEPSGIIVYDMDKFDVTIPEVKKYVDLITNPENQVGIGCGKTDWDCSYQNEDISKAQVYPIPLPITIDYMIELVIID